MTPARFAKGGKGETIRWCSARSPFGWIVVGSTQRGLCWLSLAATAAEAESSLRAEFPAAELASRPVTFATCGCGASKRARRRGPCRQPRSSRFPRSSRDCFSTSRVAGSAADSARRDAQLQPVGPRHGRTECNARRGSRLRYQSCSTGGAMPSRGWRERFAHRISVGSGTEEAAAGCGKRLRSVRSHPMVLRETRHVGQQPVAMDPGCPMRRCMNEAPGDFHVRSAWIRCGLRRKP